MSCIQLVAGVQPKKHSSNMKPKPKNKVETRLIRKFYDIRL